jgi:uncharacterized protein
MNQTKPTALSDRIESLDVIRGFALLGILLLNILGFGLLSSGYFNPAVGGGDDTGSLTLNLGVWAAVDVFFEGAMRALFSILFGAGVVLFTSSARERGGVLHYRRNFWLLVIGLFDAYVLLWSGDILVTYALAGMVLYPVRRFSPGKLVAMAIVLLTLISLTNLVFSVSLTEGRDRLAQGSELSASDPAIAADPETKALIDAWMDFSSDYELSPDVEASELAMRQGGYVSAFVFNLGLMAEVWTFTIPVIMFWDALAMMLLGMALFKWRVLDASRSTGFYVKLMCVGFALGISINLYELYRAYVSDFDPLIVHGYMRASYHVGRLGMAFGYLGLVMWVCQREVLQKLRFRLAAVGRMALTNYLMHSLIALFLFTGAGLGLAGELQRWQLYIVVFAVWLVQLIISPWWLSRFRFGPVEWLWRAVTYLSLPPLRVSSTAS